LLVFATTQDSIGGGFTPLDAVKGEVDGMRLWNTFDRQELMALHDHSLENAETVLADCGVFNDGAGFILTDTSPNGNNLVLEGPIWTDSTVPIYAPDVSSGGVATATTAGSRQFATEARIPRAHYRSLRARRTSSTMPS
jgi:hypothetical protein